MIKVVEAIFLLTFAQVFFCLHYITVLHEIFLKGQVWSKDEIYQQHYEV